ncbi:beta strand repeat-containing protein [Leptothoe kymatousa]|uniref:Filamentous hemagglutinin N-terminal domain-containing protein n=1 Tax=Leptothoe kymatousa TAU-MAC 1615 TaxID=2364775 RepID=A0ABS5Y4S7_9CYAN|nr:filamentous hemagglutinin N-terminal domain-containing protein [Leptothoe kymatousa]MBT9312830.1 filamentous hemagglutinin N-terminal domain-containing protein [Leptothoe kymatousa TAU-MAC 1615]
MNNNIKGNGRLGPCLLSACLMVGMPFNQEVRADGPPIPDNTLGAESSLLNSLDPLTQLVAGGAIRDSNLFHSFWEFNVPESSSVYFANPAAVESILTRVTGDNPSTILGRLGVQGDANLFLLNPNGIVFGEAATLDVNGSFYASTAEAISLGDGVFSATEPSSSRLLTVDPTVTFFNHLQTGLQTGLGDISNSGDLSVGSGETLTLFGATVLSDGALSAPRGTVQVLGDLVGLVDQATVDVSGADGGGTVLIGGDYQGQGTTAERTTVGADVVIAADALETGDGGRVIVWADNATQFLGEIRAQGGPQGGDGGFVEVSGLAVLDFGGVVNTQAVAGESGQLLLDPVNILIAETPDAGFTTVEQTDGVLADFLYGALEDEGQNSHLTPGTVEALLALNDLTLEATNVILVEDDINLFSENQLRLRASVIGVLGARLRQFGGGDIVLETPQVDGNFILVEAGQVLNSVAFSPSPEGGDMNITTYDLLIRNNGVVGAITADEGNSGQVKILAANDIIVDGANAFIISQVGSNAFGDSGGVSITTNNLSIQNGATVNSSTFGNGKAGQVDIAATGNITVDGSGSGIGSTVGEGAVGDSEGISIITNNLSVQSGAAIITSTFGNGNAGKVEITATHDTIVDGTDSFIGSEIGSNAVGDSGGVSITTNNLSVRNSAQVSGNTSGQGNAGQVKITATGNTIVEGTNSFIGSEVVRGAIGDSEGISIITNNLSVLDAAILSSSTFGEGNSGQVKIVARGDITVSGIGSFIDSQVGGSAVGNSGGILLVANNLLVENAAVVSASTFSKGNSGQIEILATGNTTVDGINSGITSEVGSLEAVGNSGGVSITTNNLSVQNNAVVTASTGGEGDSGQVKITATGDTIIDGTGSFIVSEVIPGAVGNSQGVSITTNNLFVQNNAQVSTNTFSNGNSGQIEIVATGNIIVDGADSGIGSEVLRRAVGDSGGVSITTNDLHILNGGAISTNAGGVGNSGRVEITAIGDIIVDGNNSFIGSEVIRRGVGNSEGVSIKTNNLSVQNNAIVSASTFGNGNSGQVEILATGDILVSGNNSFIDSRVDGDALGDSGGVSIIASNLSVQDNSQVGASTFGEGNSGQVEILVTGNVTVDGTDSSIDSQVGEGAVGDSGGVSITASNLSLRNGASVTTRTDGNGTAGVLRLQSNPDTDLNVVLAENGSINTLTNSQKNGGDLIIRSDRTLTIQGPGELTTESLGTNTGSAGNLNITANSVLLDDGVELSTQTASIEGGGNINFDVDRSIILRRGSFINAESTSATPGSGSGGNINLNASSLVVIPAENSDIIANAIGGDGGNIQINAAGIFGPKQQTDLTTPELRANGISDISASSQSGRSGTIDLNADFEQTQALDELPDNFVNADQLVASSCIARSDNNENSLLLTGAGGLPQQPGEPPRISYPTGTVQASSTAAQPIQEPHSIYQLANGRLVMGRPCNQN